MARPSAAAAMPEMRSPLFGPGVPSGPAPGSALPVHLRDPRATGKLRSPWVVRQKSLHQGGTARPPATHPKGIRTEPVPAAADSQNTHMHNLTVLVLDDDPPTRALMVRFLAAHGYQSAEAGTMTEAIDVMGSTRIDAVILDVRLPGAGSGLDVLQCLREQPELQSIPAIVMTGAVLTEDEELMVTRKRAHLFYKPEGFNSLVGFLDQLTGRDQPH